MTGLQKGLIAGGVILVVGAVVAASVLVKGKPKGTEVYMATAKTKDLSSVVTATGKIEARTKVNVQSSVIGEIVKLPVKEGDLVKKGDLLVQIDPERYQAEVDRLGASLRIQRIGLRQAEVDLADAQRTLRRQEDLFHANGLVSRELLDKAELAEETARINLQSLKERIAQAEADLSKAKDDLSKTTIRSAIDGTVTQLNAEVGEITLTGTMNNPGTVIMIVSDMNEILAEVDVDETRVVRVEPGQKSSVIVDAVGVGEPYNGTVDEIAGSAVTRAGTAVQVFPVKILLDTKDERLRPGMTARARIETQKAESAIVVPIQAVVLRPQSDIDEALTGKKADEKAAEKKTDSLAPTDKEIVFKVVDGKTQLTQVKTGLSDETNVVILEGLAEGDTVVTGPYRTVKALKNGEKVRKKEGEEKKDEGESAVQVEVD